MLKEILKMSFKNLRSNTLRTALSILGVLIGIASIIALMTLGQGVSSSVTDQLSGLGGNRITVQLSSTKVKAGFTDEDITRFAALPSVTAVSPVLTQSYVQVITNDSRSAQTGGYSTYTQVMGTTEYFFRTDSQIILKYNRGLTSSDVQQKMNYCVLGSTIAEKLFGNINPRGATIFLNNYEFVVVDVLKEIQGTNLAYNSFVFMPYTTARDRLLLGEVKQLEILVSDSGSVDAVYSSAKGLVDEMCNYNSNYYKITNQKLIMDLVVTISDLIIGMLGGIAGIALVVGGIGIMNMMLVSVRERTSEIGLRLALGARPGSILLQFLVESVIISLIGGILGVGIGILIAYVACNIIGAVFQVSAGVILLSVAFSAGVGILFGFLPARKASKLNPIDALKSV